jgi:hypothetical protein
MKCSCAVLLQHNCVSFKSECERPVYQTVFPEISLHLMKFLYIDLEVRFLCVLGAREIVRPVNFEEAIT